MLDSTLGVQLAWTVDAGAGLLHACVRGSASWVAVGFGNDFPYMYGADIVLGHEVAGSPPCVRSLFSNTRVGFPSALSAVALSNVSVTSSPGP